MKVRVLTEQDGSSLELASESFFDRIKLRFSMGDEFLKKTDGPQLKCTIPLTTVVCRVLDSKGRLRGIDFGNEKISFWKIPAEGHRPDIEKWLSGRPIPVVSLLVHTNRLLRTQFLISNFVWLTILLSLYAFFVARFVPKNYGDLDLNGAQNVQRVWILISLLILAGYPLLHFAILRKFLRVHMVRRSLALESIILAALGFLMMCLSYDASYKWIELWESFDLYLRQVFL